MSVAAPSTIDPRVEFWSDPSYWPRNATGVTFLARIVHHLGSQMFGGAWKGNEPETIVIHAIRPHLSADTPKRDIDYACALLRARHLGYRQRSEALASLGHPQPLPTPDEWAVAKAWSEEIENDTVASLDRFYAVVDVLTRVFEQGVVKTGLRPFHAGHLVLLSPGDWFNECYPAWFATCQVDPEHRYSRMPIRYGGHWIYVDLESYLNWLALAFDAVGKRTEPVGQKPDTAAVASEYDKKATAAERQAPNDIGPSSSTESCDEEAAADNKQDLDEPDADAGSNVESAVHAFGDEDRWKKSAPRRRKGAPSRYDWQAFSEEVLARIKSARSPKSIHKFADEMAEWCALNWSVEPSNSVLRKRIADVLDENGLCLSNTVASANG